jgi:hypothetical protein
MRYIFYTVEAMFLCVMIIYYILASYKVSVTSNKYEVKLIIITVFSMADRPRRLHCV